MARKLALLSVMAAAVGLSSAPLAAQAAPQTHSCPNYTDSEGFRAQSIRANVPCRVVDHMVLEISHVEPDYTLSGGGRIWKEHLTVRNSGWSFYSLFSIRAWDRRPGYGFKWAPTGYRFSFRVAPNHQGQQ